ncbi:UNKNOWN [Stylonychia lemnae]|uniref:Uncharacterized protein n=1 Tax=Stylonychia lemnae TaxID=5949 RepID=A0A077ZSW9_STYLE|nr:UNKNOWN [Stylonychia lemnae]|eukprot:CDW72649.1 UNKNOWN [Stylonychia lemnae]
MESEKPANQNLKKIHRLIQLKIESVCSQALMDSNYCLLKKEKSLNLIPSAMKTFLENKRLPLTSSPLLNAQMMYPTNLQHYQKAKMSMQVSSNNNPFRKQDSQGAPGTPFRKSSYQSETVMSQNNINNVIQNNQSNNRSPDQFRATFTSSQLQTKRESDEEYIPHVNQYYHQRVIEKQDRSEYYYNKMQQSPPLDRLTKKILQSQARNSALESQKMYLSVQKKNEPRLLSSQQIRDKEILDLQNDDESNERDDEVKSITEQEDLQISNIKHDTNTFYEYGPKEEMKRFKYQPQVIKPTKRSKVKLYTDQQQFDIRDSRFFSSRGKSSQVNSRVVSYQFAKREESMQRQFRVTTPFASTNIDLDNQNYNKTQQVGYRSPDMLNRDNLADTNILLKNKKRYQKKMAIKRREQMNLINQADLLLSKKDSFAEMLDSFSKKEKISKSKDIDNEFLQFIAKSKAIPTKFNSTYNEKIYLFQKVEDQNDSKILFKDSEEGSSSNVKSKYYKQIAECHSFIRDALNAKTKEKPK